MGIPKQNLLKKIIFSMFCCSGLLGVSNAEASPSETYQDYLDCWNNSDFVTPKTQNYRYCLLNNGKIKKW